MLCLAVVGVYGAEGNDFPKNDCGEASRSEWRVVGRRRRCRSLGTCI